MHQATRVLALVALLAAGATPITVGASDATVSAWLQGWPMSGHDPQRTNHTDVVGPTQLHLLFHRSGVYLQPLFGPDGSAYGWSTKGLFSLTPSGRRRWVFPSSEGDAGGPPALAPNGMLYATGYPSHFPGEAPGYARIFGISPSGHLRFSRHPNQFAKGAAPFAGADNAFYAPFVGPYSGKLVVVSPQGRVLRRLIGDSFESVTQALDGTIYAFLKDTGFVAFDPGGKVKWEHLLNVANGLNVPILVGSQGNVYVANGDGVDDYDPDGHLVWHAIDGSPVLALAQAGNGSLLMADSHSLTELDTAGSTSWHASIGPSDYLSPQVLAVDGAGKIYTLGSDGVLHIISDSGSELSQTPICSKRSYARPGLALGPGGRLATVCTDGVLRVYGP